MPQRDTSVQYHRKNLRLYIQPWTDSKCHPGTQASSDIGLKLRLYIQPGPALNTTQGHKHPIV